MNSLDEPRKYPVDSGIIPSISIEEHIVPLYDLIGWLKSENIDTSNTRIPKYIKFLEDYEKNDSLDPENNEEDKDTITEYLYVLRETHELIWIFKGIKKQFPEGVVNLFKKSIGGKNYARHDKDSTARNYQFELRILSYFLRRDWEVDITSRTDIITRKNKFTFYIECKRLSSKKKIESRVREAAKQLDRKTKKTKLSRKDLGIAVFDVTKIAYPHQGVTWGVTYDHCKDIIQNKLKEIEVEYDFYGPFFKNKNVILIWLQIHIPSLNIGLSHPATRFSSLFLPIVPKSGYRYNGFETLRSAIEVDPFEL